jgi:dihydroorotase
MSDDHPDLVITAGRVYCADTGLDGRGGVAVKDRRIIASGPDVSGPAAETLDYPDAIILPGLVDLHAHPAPLSWRWGIDADTMMLRRGSTTVMSQGDAGARTWPQYREQIVDASQTRVLMALSPAVLGEYEKRGVFINLDEVDVEACVGVIKEDDGHIWGLASNLSNRACGDNDPREVMRRILEIAERTGKPILYGTRREPYDWPLSEQLESLRPGDVVTYCFIDPAETLDSRGKVVDALWKARERGVLFDLGLGKGTSDMGAAEAAIAAGFLPDTVSSDVHNSHLGWDPPHDLPKTISRIMAVGLAERDAFTMSTLRPAQVLGLAGEVGTLAPGAAGDISVLRWNQEPVPLADTPDGVRSGPALEPVVTVRAGRVFEP